MRSRERAKYNNKYSKGAPGRTLKASLCVCVAHLSPREECFLGEGLELGGNVFELQRPSRGRAGAAGVEPLQRRQPLIGALELESAHARQPLGRLARYVPARRKRWGEELRALCDS